MCIYYNDTCCKENAVPWMLSCAHTAFYQVVYFPAGTYLISSPIVDYYYTQLIGNPNALPTLRASGSFSGFALIDADPYYTSNLNWGSTNVFYRQIRNMIIDMTAIPCTAQATGIHWPTAQATSLQNLVFDMCASSGTQHVGLFIESGMCLRIFFTYRTVFCKGISHALVYI